MQVHPSFPAKTLPEFIAYAKANPGKVNMASVGMGPRLTSMARCSRQWRASTMVHVPYRANPISDLLSGHVQVWFAAIPSSLGYIRAGTLRALAVTTAARSALLPDIPAMGELVPGYEASAWQSVGVPERHSRRDHRQAQQGDQCRPCRSQVGSRMAELGACPSMTPVEFGKFIADETEKWAKVISARISRWGSPSYVQAM